MNATVHAPRERTPSVWQTAADAAQALHSTVEKHRTTSLTCHYVVMGKFLSIADVAEYLNVSAGQVRTLIRSGQLPAIQVGGRGQWRIETTELQKYVEACSEITPPRIAENHTGL